MAVRYHALWEIAVSYCAAYKIGIFLCATWKMGSSYCAICQIALRYRAISKMAVPYCAAWKIGNSFWATCKIGISYRAICKIGVCYRVNCTTVTLYHAICKIAVRYRAICRIEISYGAICMMNFLIESLVYGDVVEARLNFRRSYLWWFRNHACGVLIGTNRIEMDLLNVPPGLAWGEGLAWLRVCGAQWTFDMVGERRKDKFWYFCSLQYFNCQWWVVVWSKKSFSGPVVIASFVF